MKEILLVEDDTSIATVVTAALEEEGFAVTHCTSIECRDAKLGGQSFAVMLTDVMLEDGDGIETLALVTKSAIARKKAVQSCLMCMCHGIANGLRHCLWQVPTLNGPHERSIGSTRITRRTRTSPAQARLDSRESARQQGLSRNAQADA